MSDSNAKAEWKEMPPDAPIRQGDLLLARNRKTRDVERMAVVITADCDIDKRKYGSHFACLSVVFHDAYVRTTWAERALEAAKEKALARAAEKIRSHHTQLLGETSSLSAGAVEDWLIRSPPEAIAADLEIDERDAKGFINFVSPCHAALGALIDVATGSPFEQLQAFTAAYKNLSHGDTRAELLRAARDTTLPSDTFLLLDFPGAPGTPVVVLLRQVLGISSDAVKTRQSEIGDPNHYLRVGRLRSTFKFALSQSFGALYSKIGLPNTYEARRKSVLNGTLSYEWK